jgi:hypothetical protein
VPRKLVPWVLLAAAVIVAIAVVRRPPPPAAVPAASTALAPSQSSPVRDDPPLDEHELRDSRIHIAHEECEEGAKRINVLEGKDPTDPSAMRFIGSCLRHGNVAWYKCILRATTRLEAGTCNRRLLNGSNVP